MKAKVFLGALTVAGAMGVGCAVYIPSDAVVEVAPPTAQVEVMPVIPAPGFIWIDGFWGWESRSWHWHQGHWARPPHRGARWVPHTWQHERGGWRFHKGGWR